MSSALIFQFQSALILGLLYWGIYHRRQRKLHVRAMLSAITWDFLLILQIELSRKAIIKASKIFTNPSLLNIHVSLAISTVILYVIIIFTGRKLLQGHTELRPLHKKLGITAIVLRTATFITSFFVVI